MKAVFRTLVSFVATLVIVATLFGCASPPLTVAEAPLTIGEDFIFINSLHCNRDKSVAAMGYVGDPTAFGGMGIALHSNELGLTWHRAELGAGAEKLDISLVELPGKNRDSREQLYASGYKRELSFSDDKRPGPWWTSTDGGRSWLQSSALYPLPVSNLAEFTVYRGVLTIPLPQISVVDELGTLLTIRGGTDSRSWVNTGKLSANSLLRSTDGGQNWTVVPSQNVSKLTTIVTNGRGHAVVAGSLGTAPRQTTNFVFWSDDSGATWTRASLPNPLPEWQQGLPVMRSVLLYGNPDHVVIGYSFASIYRSEDGGRTWQGPLTLQGEGNITAMTGDSKGRLVALMASGAAMVSSDWGKTWERRQTGIQVSPQEGMTGTDSMLISAGNGVIVGVRYSRFTRSTDWGETWNTVDSQLPAKRYRLRIACTDGHGLIVVGGDWGMLTRSVDWGATWQRAHLAE